MGTPYRHPRIVAVTPPVVEFLGYQCGSQIARPSRHRSRPTRYHQAHIAETTLNATNGRDRLLHVPLTVPVLRSDGTEVPVELRVAPRRLENGHRVFVAHYTIPDKTPNGAPHA